MKTDRAANRRLLRRAARLGMDVPPELRAEMRDVLAAIARDKAASPRERRAAASALIAAHRAEMEALKIAMEVQSFASLAAELAELQELIDGQHDGEHRPGAGRAPEDATGPPAV